LLHEPINVSDVESVNIWGNTSEVASSIEKQDIVKWFNSITNIRENKGCAGTTPDAGIIIKLKTGSQIIYYKFRFGLRSATAKQVWRCNILLGKAT